MNESNKKNTSRREFLKNTGRLAATAAAAAGIVRPGYAAESNNVNIALIGCGGRGTGAVKNALSVISLPIKLVAMADVFENRLKGSYNDLNEKNADQMDVTEDRRFIGLDAYKNAMDCLRPGDVAIFATPPAFRWVHFTYAIQKGLVDLNV